MNKVPELINPSVITKVGDECVILPNNVTEDCLVGLANETAAFVIEKIDGVMSVEQIADAMCESYEVDKLTAVKTIEDFVIFLEEKGVCKWK